MFSNYFAVRILDDEAGETKLTTVTNQDFAVRILDDEAGETKLTKVTNQDDEAEVGLPTQDGKVACTPFSNQDEVGKVACTPPAPTFQIRTSPAPSLHIPGFTHPVEEHWLEEILMMTGFIIEPGSQYAKRERSAEVRRCLPLRTH